jgi:DeoR/GlpR family transcriptional regulator of sugar metabolism
MVREHGLNERQAAALGQIMHNGAVTIQEFEALFPEVTRRTLQRDLKSMVDKGIITTDGATHHLAYRLPTED